MTLASPRFWFNNNEIMITICALVLLVVVSVYPSAVNERYFVL